MDGDHNLIRGRLQRENRRHWFVFQMQQRPEKLLRPLPVDCWDWTGGLRAFASARAVVENPPLVLSGGWGARASGLSHLTYETTGTFTFHQLDQPPFPCSLTLNRGRRGVKGEDRRFQGSGIRGQALPGAVCRLPKSLRLPLFEDDLGVAGQD